MSDEANVRLLVSRQDLLAALCAWAGVEPSDDAILGLGYEDAGAATSYLFEKLQEIVKA